MRVLIVATGITREKAGVGIYARNLLDHLTASPGDLQFYLLVQDDDPELDFGSRPNVSVIRVRARWFRLLPLRFLLEQIYLPWLLFRLRIEIVHSLHYAFPLFSPGVRRVVTFHDVTFLTMPELHERLKVVYFRFFMRAMRRLADASIFISHSALEDYTAQLGSVRGRAVVVPHGKGSQFRPDACTEPVELRARYGLPERFILFLGTLEPRKNLLRLLQAFAVVSRQHPTLCLVIAGNMGWKMEELNRTLSSLELGDRIFFPGYVAETDKPALLATCELFVYPSLYEGFGLPALEAIACGAPTVTSSTSALPEVVGDAALLVDPTDTAALADAIHRVLNSPELRAQMRQKGPERASLFTWQRTADATAGVYRSCMQKATAHPKTR